VYSITGKVLETEGTSLKNSIVTLSNGQSTSITEFHTFAFYGLEKGNYQLILCGASIDTISRFIQLQSDTSIVMEASKKSLVLQEFVITATRTERPITEVTIPITVITSEQIKKMGAVRLSDVLQEQTGLTLISDHGTGIQLQGMSSEYTQILLNGQPLIGRTAGTFDLTRIAVGNIKRIEIIKGPSSCLYGSEALAGVINIITEEPKFKQTNSEFTLRYGSNRAITSTASFSYASRRFSSSVFLDRFSTSGYYLGESQQKVSPPHQQYTLQTNLGYKLNSSTKIKGYLRGAVQHQQGELLVLSSDSSSVISDNSKNHDVIASLSLDKKLNDKHSLTARLYSSLYATDSDMRYRSNPSVRFDRAWFKQELYRPEIQHQFKTNKGNELVSGLGYTYENVEATRYTQLHYFSSLFVFTSYDMKLHRLLSITGGARWDAHNVYGNQINPKFSLRWQASKKM
jgi:outer membrane receptor for ferrienterochelin and colicins